MLKLNRKGFTLIELLVVIAIIGVLGSIVFAPFNEARKKGRDGKRVAELKTLQSTLTLFADDHDGCFPKSNSLISAPNSIEKNNNKYVSQTFAAKIKSLNSAAALTDAGNEWSATAPYGFRSVGPPASCSMSGALPSTKFYPYYQLAVELETKASALTGDTDADYTGAVYGDSTTNGGANFVGLNMSVATLEACALTTPGTWECVFDIDN